MSLRESSVVRLLVAFRVLLPVILTHARDTRRYVVFGGRRALDDEERRERARHLADAFERLGVTYIKIAQFLTTRPDFVPPVYIDELQRLQDEVPPEEFGEVERVLDGELGGTEVFDSFDDEPVSSASIAQVHRATLDGNEVAVKVQRPRLHERIEADLTALNGMVAVMTRLMRLTGEDTHAGTMLSVTRDVNESLRKEIEFDRETETMREIHDAVEREGFDDEVVVPEPYEEYSTSRVITMSYENGVKIKDMDELERRGHDLSVVARRFVEAYLRMAFVYGVYQTDPHHGNLAVADDGRVVIYDYGMAQRPDDEVTEAFARFLLGLGTRDHDVTIAALEDLGSVEIRSREQWDAMCDWADALAMDVAGEVAEIDIGKVARRFNESFDDFPIQLNQDILLSLRAITGVQGVATTLDPDYDFSAHLARFFVEQNAFDLDLEEVRRDARERSERLYLDSMKDEIVEEVRRASVNAINSVVGATLALSAVVLYVSGAGAVVPALLFVAGAAVLVNVGLSFRESDRVSGPMFMMRYEMEKWDDGTETERDGDANGTEDATERGMEGDEGEARVEALDDREG